ncbi:MAG: hypothetical protein HQM11_07005 [SAR324 cluster bacterium]|nr:hypothetical protein [SAR324 cluster bacterium]
MTTIYRFVWILGIWSVLHGMIPGLIWAEEEGSAKGKLAELEWHTIETRHFFVHYHDDIEELARLCTVYAEESHEILAPLLDWEPQQKTHMIITDILDNQDGNARNLPYPILRIYPYPPTINSAIAEYESSDWLRILILHEYVHILNLDTVAGYSKVVRDWFGRPGIAFNPLAATGFLHLNSPNNFAPPWLTEGLAVYLETELTHSGRGISPKSEMLFRMGTKLNDLISLDQLDFYRLGFPGQHASRYIYGAYFLDYLISERSPEYVGKLNHLLAEWPPYMGIHMLEDESGAYLVAAYERFLEYTRTEHEKRLAILETQSLTQFQGIQTHGFLQRNFALSPDERKMAFVLIDVKGQKHLKLWREYPLTGGYFRELAPAATQDDRWIYTTSQGIPVEEFETLTNQDALSLSWHPSEKYLFYTALSPEGIYSFQELFVYDFKTAKTHQLTTNARIGDVDVSPDGKFLIGVESGKGHQNLVLYELTEIPDSGDKPPFKAMRLDVLTKHQYSRVSQPKWDHQGKRLVYSLSDRKGDTFLPIIDMESRQEIKIISQGHLQSNPVWEPGDNAILFSSDHTGVSNIYRYSLESEVMLPITHVLGGALEPVISRRKERLYFQNFYGEGLELAFIEWKAGQTRSEPLPQITPVWKHQPELAVVRDGSVTQSVTEPQEPYSPWQSMFPQFWFIYAEDAPGGYAWGLITAGVDALEEQGYYGAVTYGEGQPYYRFSYYTDHWYPNLSFSSSLLPQRYSKIPNLRQGWELLQEHVVGISFKLDDWSLGFNYLNTTETPYEDSGFLTEANKRATEKLATAQNPYRSVGDYFKRRTFTGNHQGFNLFSSYSTVSHFPTSISEESGSYFSVGYTHYPTSLGDNPEIKTLAGEDFDAAVLYMENTDPGFSYDQLTPRRAETLASLLHAKEQLVSNEYQLLTTSYGHFFSSPWPRNVFHWNLNGGVGLNGSELSAEFMTRVNIPVRGYKYDLETARQYISQTIEWRMPLGSVFRGIGLIPFYSEQVHTALFYDYAVFSGGYTATDIYIGDESFLLRDDQGVATRRGTGFELKLRSKYGYRFPVDLIVRYSYAPDINNIAGIDGKKGYLLELDYETSF